MHEWGPYFIGGVNLIGLIVLWIREYIKSKKVNQLERTADKIQEQNKILSLLYNSIDKSNKELGNQTHLQAKQIKGLKAQIIEVREIANNLKEGNRINNERNALIQKNNKDAKELVQQLLMQQEQTTLRETSRLKQNKAIEKLKIKPKFKIVSYSKDKTKGTAILKLKNYGGTATMQGCIIVRNNNVFVSKALTKIDVDTGEDYTIEWKALPMSEIGSDFQTAIAFTDDFKDIYAHVFKSFKNGEKILTTTAEGERTENKK